MSPAVSPKDFTTLIVKTIHGPVRVVVSKKGIARLEFCPKKSTYKNAGANEEVMPPPWIHEIRNRVEGTAPSLKIPLDLHGSDFQKTVWRAIARIPTGEVRSYQEIAKSIGRPRAARAVASACASNRIGILIPCHRVVRKDGSLSGYHWGVKLKRRLLECEGVLLPLTLS
ncbi:MAG: methylated-DNA--[protein]-cysteine S-methyltransferase [Chthoniobacterales bacterium]